MNSGQQQSPASVPGWHVLRRVGRTIYMQIGAEPSGNDPLIGVMDTPELALAAVAAYNLALPGVNRDSPPQPGAVA